VKRWKLLAERHDVTYRNTCVFSNNAVQNRRALHADSRHGWAQGGTLAAICPAKADSNPSKPNDNSTTKCDNQTLHQYTLWPRSVFSRELSALRREVAEVFVLDSGSAPLGNQFPAFVT